MPASDKLGSALWYLMIVRERPESRNIAGVKEVLDGMDQKGGADVVIAFDHLLSLEELNDLETRFKVRFNRNADGRIVISGASFSAIVPWEQIWPLIELPPVTYITTYLWSSTMPPAK